MGIYRIETNQSPRVLASQDGIHRRNEPCPFGADRAWLLPWVVVLLLALPIDTAHAAGTRTWTDATGGHSLEAELVDCRDGVVRLKRSDGRVISLSLEKLSAADQEYVNKGSSAASKPSESSSDDGTGASEDVVELLTGSQLKGHIASRDEKSVTIEIVMGGRDYTRKVLIDRIHAVTCRGKREVLHEKAAGKPDSEKSTAGGTSTTRTRPGQTAGGQRSRTEVDALIDKMGRTLPDWWESVPVSYPPTLDLSWPEPAPPPWNAQKNIGQYIWEVINPNPNKWREGVRFLYHLVDMYQKDPQKHTRAVIALARMYQDLLQDYARAAFWWRKVDGGGQWDRTRLAQCYWKLGNKQMALELVNKLPIGFATIKLLADMGETRAALRIVETANFGDHADLGYLYAGDACRIAGRYKEAIAYYQKVLSVPARGQTAERTKRNHERAQANIEGIRIFDSLDLSRVPDGTYTGTAPGYAGPVRVEVGVKAGRIDSVRVVEHHEKQFYTAMTDTPQKIIEKQGVKGIDATSSATITAEAIINATGKAIHSGLK